MNYTCYDMNAYNLHIIKTDKFKTITVSVSFREKVSKDLITIRNLLKEIMINSSNNYPSERSLVIETEKLYDLKLLSSNYRVGNYNVLSFKCRFLNEIYTESDMNDESIRFLLDIIFNPKLDSDVDKCKKKIEKSIKSLSDNKIKYSLIKLLDGVGDMPYSYNSYGYLDDLEKITILDIREYYNNVIKNDIVDVYVVGDVDEIKIKELFKEYFKLQTFHKYECDLISPELNNVRKIDEVIEYDNVNQTQLTILCNIIGLSDNERKYVLPIYGEMLGGSANSILFDDVREKNSYAYYVNAIVKPYDNIMIIYSGIENGNEKNVLKLIEKSLKNISKGNFDLNKFENAKKTLIDGINSNMDNPVGIINSYYAKVLVNSPSIEERIENVKKVSKDDIIVLSKKISIYKTFILEAANEKNSD